MQNFFLFKQVGGQYVYRCGYCQDTGRSSLWIRYILMYRICCIYTSYISMRSVAYRGGVEGSTPPLPKLRRLYKIVPNSTRLWKLLKIAEFRKPTPQDVRNEGSKILKLPPVRNCFTLAMTNKLVVIINSLKVPKMKKILLYEMKFIVPNCSCLQKTREAVHRPRSPFSLSSVLNWICWTTRTKFLGKPLYEIKLLQQITNCGLYKRSDNIECVAKMQNFFFFKQVGNMFTIAL